MKRHLNPVRLFLLTALSSVIAIGCEAKDIPPPATEEQLAQSVFTFYKSETEAGPSGILLAKQQGASTHYLILTAGHVAATQNAIMRKTGDCHLGFRKAGDASVIRRIRASTDKLIVLPPPFTDANEDVGGFLAYDLAEGVTANGGALRPIRLGKSLDGGVGIIRDVSDYARYSITTGTEVVAFCSDIKKPLGNLNFDWTGSVIRRTGKIENLSAKIPVSGTSRTQNVIVVDFASENGNSGGPVFAYGLVNGVRYPFLVGVISGRLAAKKELAAVAPTWRFVKTVEAN